MDDVVIFTNDKELDQRLTNELCKNFQMKNLGDITSILGIRVTRDRKNGTIAIDQEQYINEILHRFVMDDCNPVSTPMDLNQKISSKMCPINDEKKQQMKNIPYMETIGSLLFAAQITRPDISYPVNFLSRYSQNPGKCHWSAVKRIFRFLKGTSHKKLTYTEVPNDIIGYCDADWACDLDERKSTSGYVFTMQGAAISWCSKKQPTVALSTTEAEYMAMTSAIQELIWLKKLSHELIPLSNNQIILYCDNKSTIQYVTNNSYSNRTKHIEIKSNFIREHIETGILKLVYLSTDQMVADKLTKGMATGKQVLLSSSIGLN